VVHFALLQAALWVRACWPVRVCRLFARSAARQQLIRGVGTATGLARFERHMASRRRQHKAAHMHTCVRVYCTRHTHTHSPPLTVTALTPPHAHTHSTRQLAAPQSQPQEQIKYRGIRGGSSGSMMYDAYVPDPSWPEQNEARRTKMQLALPHPQNAKVTSRHISQSQWW
jgi:hypothetical protein